MTNKNIPTVSNTDTKAAIIEKFNTVVELLKAKDATKMDPAKEVAQKAVASTLEKAATIVKADVGSQITDMADTVTKALGDALTEINTRVANYKELDDAIKLKQEEIKELFEIEASAYALVALLNMQKEQEATFDERMNARRAEQQAKLDDLIAQTEAKRKENDEAARRYTAELKETRAREQEAFDYDLSRTRKLENDKWDDEKAAREKALQNRIAEHEATMEAEDAAIEKRKEELAAQEEVIAELRAKVDSIPQLVAEAAAKAAKDAATSEARGFQFQKQMIEKDAKAAADLAAAQIKTLEEALAAEKARNITLETKLDDAYAKIESISGKAVDAAAGVKYMDRIEGMAKDSKLSAVK